MCRSPVPVSPAFGAVARGTRFRDPVALVVRTSPDAPGHRRIRRDGGDCANRRSAVRLRSRRHARRTEPLRPSVDRLPRRAGRASRAWVACVRVAHGHALPGSLATVALALAWRKAANRPVTASV